MRKIGAPIKQLPITIKIMVKKSQLILSWASIFPIGLMNAASLTYYIIYANHFGLSGALIGISLTFRSLVFIASAPYFGRLSDKIGKSTLITGALCLYILIFFLMPLASQDLMIVFLSTLMGLCSGMLIPSAMALTIEGTDQQNRTIGMSIYTTVFRLGSFLGLSVMSAVVAIYDIIYVFYLTALMVFLTLIGMFFLMRISVD